MMYDVKCTHCISLLMNYKRLKDAYFFMAHGEAYIQVKNDVDKALIEKIEYHMGNAYWYYNRLLETC